MNVRLSVRLPVLCSPHPPSTASVLYNGGGLPRHSCAYGSAAACRAKPGELIPYYTKIDIERGETETESRTWCGRLVDDVGARREVGPRSPTSCCSETSFGQWAARTFSGDRQAGGGLGGWAGRQSASHPARASLAPVRLEGMYKEGHCGACFRRFSLPACLCCGACMQTLAGSSLSLSASSPVALAGIQRREWRQRATERAPTL